MGWIGSVPSHPIPSHGMGWDGTGIFDLLYPMRNFEILKVIFAILGVLKQTKNNEKLDIEVPKSNLCISKKWFQPYFATFQAFSANFSDFWKFLVIFMGWHGIQNTFLKGHGMGWDTAVKSKNGSIPRPMGWDGMENLSHCPTLIWINP